MNSSRHIQGHEAGTYRNIHVWFHTFLNTIEHHQPLAIHTQQQ